MNHPKIEAVDFESNDIYIFFSFYSFGECVCVCIFVWFCLYSFAFNICPRALSVHFSFFFSIVFSACYHWWICFLVWLFFLSIFFCFYYFLIVFIFNNYFLFFILITLYYFIFSFFLFSFFSPLSSEPCGWQGLGAQARCQACASEVGDPSSDHLAPRNIKWRKLSQRSPSQH